MFGSSPRCSRTRSSHDSLRRRGKLAAVGAGGEDGSYLDFHKPDANLNQIGTMIRLGLSPILFVINKCVDFSRDLFRDTDKLSPQ